MSASPFTFFRGTAKIMAHDLATTPSTGIHPQICGDAHLSNFGAYGAPDRSLVFDINDFDETLPGPWEWDLKRLATSFAVAGRSLSTSAEAQRSLAMEVASNYRDAMRKLADMPTLDVWYLRIGVDDITKAFADQLSKKELKKSEKWATKTRTKGSLHAFDKLGEATPQGIRIASAPPDVIPLRDMEVDRHPDDLRRELKGAVEAYLRSVPDHMATLLRRYRIADFAAKVVGVGSVGTRCFIVLLESTGPEDLLFLQIKEANSSVLEDVLEPSSYEQAGRRVVEGQRLMQTATDSFLGWTAADASGRSYYWRQLKDMKGSVDVEEMDVDALMRYAALCGHTLARSHARSASASDIAAYIGKGDVLPTAIGEFSMAYADQNDRDYAEFMGAIRSGAIEAHA
jgi:uncharacterized protein (DUF2252 family)